jgi:cbb3-type cytochrome oxidase cytochrome c subunit
MFVLGSTLTGCAPFSGPRELDRGVDSADWAKRQHFENNQAAIEGAQIFVRARCLQCHTYLGQGAANVGAPDLSTIGRTGRTATWFAAYVANPARYGNEVMPRFDDLGKENLRKLGAFL